MLTFTHSRLPAAHIINGASRLIRDPPQQYRPAAIPLAAHGPFESKFTPGPGRPRRFWSSAPRAASRLAGTAPYHSAYVLLHTHAPPKEYPPRSKSALWRGFTLRARQWGGVVNFAWAPEHVQAVHPAYVGLGEAMGDAGRRSDGDGDGEAYVASVFSSAHPGARFVIPEVTLANLDAVNARLGALVRGEVENPASRDEPGVLPVTEEVEVEEVVRDKEKLFLYVCTHGSRDCRCGDSGGDVARALGREIDSRELADDILLGEVAHVGGHKYAANILVYPYGEWLGTVQELDVPQVLDELVAWRDSHRDTKSLTDRPPLCPPFWRGRMGLDKEEQIALHSERVH